MKIQNTKQENTSNMTTYFENLTVNFNSYAGIKQADKTDKDRFYKFIHQKNSNSSQETTFT